MNKNTREILSDLRSKLQRLRVQLDCAGAKSVSRHLSKTECAKSELVRSADEISTALSAGVAPNLDHMLIALRACRRLGAVVQKFERNTMQLAAPYRPARGPEIVGRLDDAVDALTSASRPRPIHAQRIADSLLPLVGPAAKAPLSAEETLELENFAKRLAGLSNSDIVSRIKRGEIDLSDARAFHNAATGELPEYLRGQEPFASATFRLTGVFTELGHENPVEELEKLEKSTAGAKAKAEGLASLEVCPQVQVDEEDLRKFASGELDADEIEREWQRVSDKIERWNDAGRPTTHGDYKELETQIFKLGRLRRLAKRADNSFTK